MATSVSSANVSGPLVDFLVWCSNGGPSSCGLEQQPFVVPHDQAAGVLAQCKELHSGLQGIADMWENVCNASLAPAVAALYTANLVARLGTLDDSIKATRDAAGNLRSLVQPLLTSVTSQQQAMSTQVDDAQRRLTDARRNRDQALSDYNSAKEQLEGATGFWNGMKTVFTFGRYNVQDEVDRANRDVARYNQAIADIPQQISRLQQSRAALDGCRTGLQRLSSLDDALRDCQNMANAADRAVSAAHADEQHALASSESLAAYYSRCAGHDMTRVIACKDMFSTGDDGTGFTN